MTKFKGAERRKRDALARLLSDRIFHQRIKEDPRKRVKDRPSKKELLSEDFEDA